MSELLSENKLVRHLHPTKGWRKGEPRMTKRFVKAAEFSDGKVFWDPSKPKRKRVMGGTWTMGNGRKNQKAA